MRQALDESGREHACDRERRLLVDARAGPVLVEHEIDAQSRNRWWHIRRSSEAGLQDPEHVHEGIRPAEALRRRPRRVQVFQRPGRRRLRRHRRIDNEPRHAQDLVIRPQRPLDALEHRRELGHRPLLQPHHERFAPRRVEQQARRIDAIRLAEKHARGEVLLQPPVAEPGVQLPAAGLPQDQLEPVDRLEGALQSLVGEPVAAQRRAQRRDRRRQPEPRLR